MSWGGLDQRVFPRVSARCDISIHDRIEGAIKTKTQNLGLGGVCVILNRELEKLTRVHLHFMLDEPNQTVDCDGRVVWMVRSKEPASGKVTYDVGIEFMDLKPQGRELISAFLKKHA